MDGLPLTRRSPTDVRTGTFFQPLVTMGDTVCSVNGVSVMNQLAFTLSHDNTTGILLKAF